MYDFVGMYFRARKEWPHIWLIARCIGERATTVYTSVRKMVKLGVMERERRHFAPVIIRNWEG